MPARLDNFFPKEVARPDIGAAGDNEHPRAVGHFDEVDIGVVLCRVCLVRRMKGDGRVITVSQQRVTARGAEIDPLGIPVPAVVTVHGVHGPPPHGAVLLPASDAQTPAQSAIRSRYPAASSRAASSAPRGAT